MTYLSKQPKNMCKKKSLFLTRDALMIILIIFKLQDEIFTENCFLVVNFNSGFPYCNYSNTYFGTTATTTKKAVKLFLGSGEFGSL